MRIVVVGGTSGLGKALAETLFEKKHEVFVVGRKPIEGLQYTTLVSDISKSEGIQAVESALKEWRPDSIVYSVGGGPHGNFADREWKDHLWSFQTTFLAGARILHFSMSENVTNQFIFVGSDIAENFPEPMGASYGAGKRALKGLVESIRSSDTNMDVRLFSPGYMDTRMIPKNAEPRLKYRLLDPKVVSEDIVDWMMRPVAEWHRRYPSPS
ncbi:MAG: SDR family NAD(P)-dependent oxidoreductase [Bdellovibrionales bacterium]|nr:SDR family NAD(P)-dependent oxidoreductase [Bdellovibrionales bacterium]